MTDPLVPTLHEVMAAGAVVASVGVILVAVVLGVLSWARGHRRRGPRGPA